MNNDAWGNKMMRDAISGKTFSDLNYEQATWLVENKVPLVLNGPSCYISAPMQLLDFDIGMRSKKVCGIFGASLFWDNGNKLNGCFIITTIVLDWKIYFEDDFDPNDLAGNMQTGMGKPVGYHYFERMKEYYGSKAGQDFIDSRPTPW